MVFRAFRAAQRPWVLCLLALGLAIGCLEGGFVYLIKAALNGNSRDWRLPLGIAFALVSLRSLLQWTAARVETSAVFGWIGARRSELLGLAGDRCFPAYRDPWRSALARNLDAGLKDMAEGAAAGLRGFAAAVQAAALLPLLFFFSWKPALAALALALPALWLSRLRSASLADSAKAWGASAESLAGAVEDYAEGLEAASGNGRLAAASAALSGAEARHESLARRWELAKALFPPLLEWLFFAALAALLVLAAPARGTGAAWTGSLLPFAALLLLLYRPIREWARAHPARLPGDRAWLAYRNLRDTLAALPGLRAPARAGGDKVVCERVRFGYGGDGPRTVFRSLSLELDPVGLTWIPGPNGSGKSTFLRLLAGVEAPDAGRILLPASLLASPRPFAYLPQRAVIEPDWRAWAERFSREQPAEWGGLEVILGLKPLLERARSGSARAWAATLSGGQRQRLALARVFASDAPCLLLDEPTTWLAGGDRERVLGDLLALRARRPGSGAVLVSHEVFLGEFCSRTLRLEAAEGRAVEAADRRAAEAADGQALPQPRDKAAGRSP